jgi:hypothetical protein
MPVYTNDFSGSKLKNLEDMYEGEVCYCPKKDVYVIRVNLYGCGRGDYQHEDCFWISLKEGKTVSVYSSMAKLKVRSLAADESVTLTFK